MQCIYKSTSTISVSFPDSCAPSLQQHGKSGHLTNKAIITMGGEANTSYVIFLYWITGKILPQCSGYWEQAKFYVKIGSMPTDSALVQGSVCCFQVSVLLQLFLGHPQEQLKTYPYLDRLITCTVSHSYCKINDSLHRTCVWRGS